MSAITEFDFYLLEAISRLRNGILTPIMKALTYAGSGGLVWIVICFILIIYPKTRKIGIYAAAALAVEYVIGELTIKPLIARERPFIQHPWIDTIIKHPTSYSFPSGHTSSSAAVAASIFIQNKKLSIPFIILAVGIMFSRLYFCVHFPSDILFGIIHGILWAVITYQILKMLTDKKAENTKQ